MIIKDETGMENLISGIARQAVKDYRAAAKGSPERKEIEWFFTNQKSWFNCLNIDGGYILRNINAL